MHKQRNYVKSNKIDKTILIQENGRNDYKDKTAIICDDIADTCGTLISAVNSLVENGIKDVICVITHGIFSNDAIERINEMEAIKKVFVSDSIPQDKNITKCGKIQVFTLSILLSDVIYRIINKKPLSDLFAY